MIVPTRFVETRPWPTRDRKGLPYWGLMCYATMVAFHLQTRITPVSWDNDENAFDSSTIAFIKINGHYMDVASIRRDEWDRIESFNLPEVSSDYSRLIPRRASHVRSAG